MTGDTYWLVSGHYCATDASPPMEAEDEVTTYVCSTKECADTMILWYPFGTITQVEERPSDDSGGSSYLCSCAGVDTGRHSEWCGYLSLFQPVAA